MFGGKLYNDNIPKSVRKPLLSFTGNVCLLVKREMQADDDSLAGNCHANVARYCAKFPASKSSAGWILEDLADLVKKGVWTWAFHSVCLKSGKTLVDITENAFYDNKSESIFWLDERRKADLITGTNYNNIVVFENQRIADHIGDAAGQKLNAGEIYWTTRDLKEYRRISEHNGKYEPVRNFVFEAYHVAKEHVCQARRARRKQ